MRYVVIGGIAARIHGLAVPATIDIDIVPARDHENLERLARVFEELEAGLFTADGAGAWFPRIPADHWAQYDTLHLRTSLGPLDIVFVPDGAPTGYTELVTTAQRATLVDQPVMEMRTPVATRCVRPLRSVRFRSGHSAVEGHVPWYGTTRRKAESVRSHQRRATATARSPLGALVVGLIAMVALLATGGPPSAGRVEAQTSAAAFSSVPLASWRTNGTGRAVLKLGNVVYVGGGFTRAISPDGTQQVNRSNLAAFDVRTGALIPSFVADTDGRVDDLLFDGTSLFVSGSFRTIGGVSRTRIAAIDPTTGAVRTSFRADADNAVYSMAFAAGRLYVAGLFSNVNGLPRLGVAALSPDTGAVDPMFRPSVTGTVRTVAVSRAASTVYIGGPYTAVNGDGTAADITILDGTTGATTGPTLWDVIGFVDDLEVTPDGRSLIAAHSGFPGIGNRTVVYDATTGARRWRHVVDGDVQSVHLIGTTVWSGFHDGANDDGSLRLLGYDLATGTQDTRFRPHFDRFMGVWEVHGDTDALVVAGDFSTITGVGVEGFAIFPASGATNYAATVLGSQPWRYLDNGTDLGTAWRQPGFDDTTWRSGIGEFGYGDGGENTRVSFGTNAGDKYITTYFRTTFTSTGTPDTAGIYMRVDDGAVVYVNGIEAVRDNMPSGAIGHLTLAIARNGVDEDHSRHFPIDPALIRPGTNTIAVEVHQASRTSDDLSFFPTLIAHTITIPPTTTTTTTTTAPPTTTPPTTTSPPPATIPPSPPPPATRASTPVENDVLDLRSALPWSIRRPGETIPSGWTTAGFDDRGWAYDTAPLGDVGAFQAARTQFTADPSRPLSLMVRAVPGASVYVNGVSVIRFPAEPSRPSGNLATAVRLDRTVTVDSRLITNGTNVVSISPG